MLDNFCQENSGEFMGASLPLDLCVSLLLVPLVDVQLPDVDIERLGHHRTGADGSVGFVDISVFPMRFK